MRRQTHFENQQAGYLSMFLSDFRPCIQIHIHRRLSFETGGHQTIRFEAPQSPCESLFDHLERSRCPICYEWCKSHHGKGVSSKLPVCDLHNWNCHCPLLDEELANTVSCYFLRWLLSGTLFENPYTKLVFFQHYFLLLVCAHNQLVFDIGLLDRHGLHVICYQ